MGLIRVAMVAFFAAVVSCQTLIELGDEPTLGCGLVRPLGPECDACLQTRCCEKSLACSEDTVCRQTSEGCITTCFTPECVGACIREQPENQLLEEYFLCASECQSACTPKETCDSLSKCCRSLTDETQQLACSRSARSENQTACQNALDFFDSCQGLGGAGGE
jgi:hypothetical protein